jgi:hypothetical protein
MYTAIVDVANVYKWPMSEIEQYYLEDSTVYGLFFWQERAKEYIKNIASKTTL